jgi:hypothetical protein
VFVRAVGIDSRDGFEIGIELTAKARRLRLPIAEIPMTWLDRNEGYRPAYVSRRSGPQELRRSAM